MTDQKPKLDYAKPRARRRRKDPWWIDIPMVILTAIAVLFAVFVLGFIQAYWNGF